MSHMWPQKTFPTSWYTRLHHPCRLNHLLEGNTFNFWLCFQFNNASLCLGECTSMETCKCSHVGTVLYVVLGTKVSTYVVWFTSSGCRWWLIPFTIHPNIRPYKALASASRQSLAWTTVRLRTIFSPVNMYAVCKSDYLLYIVYSFIQAMYNKFHYACLQYVSHREQYLLWQWPLPQNRRRVLVHQPVANHSLCVGEHVRGVQVKDEHVQEKWPYHKLRMHSLRMVYSVI